jgi:hypothetical protein
MNGTDWPRSPVGNADPQRLHEERLRALERGQREAFRLLAAFRGQVNMLRQRAGLPPLPDDP